MDTHLVLVVHGVGEQVAGETVDNFVGAAANQLDLNGRSTESTIKLVDEETTEGDIRLYDCHTRRLAQDENNELYFAEVHWADLSPAPKGAWATFLALLRLILGLGYLALDSVENTRISGNIEIKRGLVRAFVALFYAGVAPLNALLLAGTLSLLIDPYIDLNRTEWAPGVLLMVLGALLSFASKYLGKWAETYLTQTFLTSLKWMSVAVACFGFALLVFGPAIIPFKNCLGCVGDSVQVATMDCISASTVWVLNGVWGLTLLVLLVLVVVVVFDLATKQVEQVPIYLAICAGISLFWGIFAVAFWVVFKEAAQSLSGTSSSSLLYRTLESEFVNATMTLPFIVLALFVLVIVTALVVFIRSRFKDDLADPLNYPSGKDGSLGRMILNPWLSGALSLSVLIFVFGAVFSFPIMCEDERAQSYFCHGHRWITSHTQLSVLIVGIIGLTVFNYSSRIAAVIGIVGDVVVYMTRSRRGNPIGGENGSRYIHREQIEARFSNTLQTLLEREKPKKLTIVSHSQGTVIAAQVLQRLKDQNEIFSPRPNLITMGSPLTHIYSHYFSKGFEFGLTVSDSSDPHTLGGWTNIYRRDDFVGTLVLGHGTRAENIPVRAAGHTGYWTDKNVWQHLLDRKVFSY